MKIFILLIGCLEPSINFYFLLEIFLHISSAERMIQNNGNNEDKGHLLQVPKAATLYAWRRRIGARARM